MARYLVWLVVGTFVAVLPAYAGKRVALVIGNSEYENVSRLKNPGNDAVDIAAAFSRLGFEVHAESNLDLISMNSVLRGFARKSRDADMSVIYYAGHGIEVDKKNWLVPVDAELATDMDVEYETVSLDLLSQTVGGASDLRLVIVDACRDNPFARRMIRKSSTRSIGRGLTRIDDPDPGTLVVFAAAEGQLAQDGDGRNSPFADALLDFMEQPGIEVNFLFRKVRDRVMADTGDRQQPFSYGSLPAREIYLKNPALEGDRAAELKRLRERLAKLENGASAAEEKPVSPEPEPPGWNMEYDDFLSAYRNGLDVDAAEALHRAISAGDKNAYEAISGSWKAFRVEFRIAFQYLLMSEGLLNKASQESNGYDYYAPLNGYYNRTTLRAIEMAFAKSGS
ncbi:MAG: caspase family protein [Rhizobiaceae bacterium]